MRELGYRTVDMLVERLLDDTVPPLRRASPAEMRERLSGPPPAKPQPFDELLRRLDEDVLPFTSRGEHPAFLAFVPFAGTWPGALGDFIASACNIYAGSWMEAAGPTQLELEVLEWFRGWIGLPRGGRRNASERRLGGEHDGARLCPRVDVVGAMNERLVAYVSDQAHSSLARGARVLGFRPDQIRVLPSGSDGRLSADDAAARGRSGRAGRAAFRSSSRRTPARRTPGRSIRSTSSPTCAASAASGSTWTRPTAGSRC